MTVATIADGLDTSNPDLQRNPAYGRPGAPVAQEVDFSGDPAGTPTPGEEMFGDVSSIAAQGNQEYNLSQYVNPDQAARLPASGCWIRIVGAAPGSNVLALKVFSTNNDTTESNFLQAIQYAVQHGSKVINESFGSNNIPDTVLDVTRELDDAAVAAGVTVVVSSGDAGVTNTTGSPATDPNLISVGATTTFRSYAQANFGGFDNPAVGNGRWADNNISALSSAGFNQSGNTVNLVAPGDLNWALCSTNGALYTDCADAFGGTDIGIQQFGGTSESAPLTSAAAADVIQAYANSHGGTDPTPALVKQVLVSTATDISAPADEQGAGLLNIGAAVKLAESLPGVARHHDRLGGGLLLSPSQVNFVGQPGTQESQQITLTNTGPSSEHVELSTRALTHEVSDSGVQTFTMDPSSLTANSGTMPIWSGVTEVYQTETFNVPWTNPGDTVPAVVLGRLPVHGPRFAAARGLVRTGRDVRGVQHPAGPRRLRRGGSNRPGAGAVDGPLLYRARWRHRGGLVRYQRPCPMGRANLAVHARWFGNAVSLDRPRGPNRDGHAQPDHAGSSRRHRPVGRNFVERRPNDHPGDSPDGRPHRSERGHLQRCAHRR